MLIKNRVLALLVAAGLLAAFALPFLTRAPNRLVSGIGIPLGGLLGGVWLALLLPAAVLVVAVFATQRSRLHAAAAVAAALLLTGWVALAGHQALLLAGDGNSIGRTSFGGSFWVLVALSALALADALQRLRLSALARTLLFALAALPLVSLTLGGALDQLSLLKEYANRQDVFRAALLRHVEIVAITLIPTLLIGAPLGLAAARSQRVSSALFAVLNIVQTVPSMALFAFLIGPLAWLAANVPWMAAHGISGIGIAPAVIALTLYSLLPVARSTAAGLAQVPAGVIEAATGMGLTRRQIFWKVEVPLALPLLLSGLRVTTVQAIGLVVVAALIGAGGLGAIVFQGLLSSALDLVLLGVVPVVALALVADAAFNVVNLMLTRPAR